MAFLKAQDVLSWNMATIFFFHLFKLMIVFADVDEKVLSIILSLFNLTIVCV